MTPFLEELARGGPAHKASMTADALTVTPVGNDEADLQAFQSVVARIRKEEGDGFSIFLEHPTSDTATTYIDVMTLAVEQ